MSLNRVVLVGKVTDTGPKLTYSEAGRPECRLTVQVIEAGRAGQPFSLFVPCFVYGPGAETAAEQVNGGDVVAVDGKLSWKSTPKQDGSKLGLCVSAFGMEVITKAIAIVGTGESSAPEG
jgi:single-stranded DNA-binding protein